MNGVRSQKKDYYEIYKSFLFVAIGIMVSCQLTQSTSQPPLHTHTCHHCGIIEKEYDNNRQ